MIFILNCLDAVPSQIPGAPAYLSRAESHHREAPEARQHRLEGEMLKRVLAESEESFRCYSEQDTYCSVGELSDKLQNTGDWIKLMRDNKLFVMLIDDPPVGNRRCCVCIDTNLSVTLFCGNLEVKRLPSIKVTFPTIVNSIMEFKKILNCASLMVNYKDGDVKDNLEMVIQILSSLQSSLPEMENTINFLLGQISLLHVVSSNRYRFNWDVTIFCSLLHSISPHVYS